MFTLCRTKIIKAFGSVSRAKDSALKVDYCGKLRDIGARITASNGSHPSGLRLLDFDRLLAAFKAVDGGFEGLSFKQALRVLSIDKTIYDAQDPVMLYSLLSFLKDARSSLAVSPKVLFGDCSMPRSTISYTTARKPYWARDST